MKLNELTENFTSLIGKGALLTAAKPSGEVNTMTVSWGGAGVLWGKEVCTVFVRPERYTFEFCEATDKMTLSFLCDEEGDTLRLCGTKSGRDVDKFAACGIKCTLEDGYPMLDRARITLKLKMLYADDIKKECFIDTESLKHYANGGYHRMYICQVTDCITA